MSIGIYKFQNKINGNIYIGQSIDIEKRYKGHLYDAKYLENNDNSEVKRRVTGVDYAIKKYGIENFTFEIIEFCNTDELDEKEIYWIDYYDSYYSGYNQTLGGKSNRGESHPRALFSEKDVWNIREKYGEGIKRSEVFKPYLEKGFTERSLLKIWNNETWIGIHEDVYTENNKIIHKNQVGHSEDQLGLSSLDRVIKQDEINQWVSDYSNGLSINFIAKKYNRDNGTVLRYINNPQEISKVKYNGRKIKNIETGIIFESINKAAKWAGCGATTLTRHLYTDSTAGKIPETNEPAHWIEIS